MFGGEITGLILCMKVYLLLVNIGSRDLIPKCYSKTFVYIHDHWYGGHFVCSPWIFAFEIPMYFRSLEIARVLRLSALTC